MDTNGTMPAKQKSLLRITHAQNDSRYVEMGKLLHLTQVPGSDGELEGMNMKKNWHPYSYPDTVIMSIAGIQRHSRSPAVPHSNPTNDSKNSS